MFLSGRGIGWEAHKNSWNISAIDWASSSLTNYLNASKWRMYLISIMNMLFVGPKKRRKIKMNCRQIVRSIQAAFAPVSFHDVFFHPHSHRWLTSDMNGGKKAPFSDEAFSCWTWLRTRLLFYGFETFSHANDTTRKTIPSAWNFQKELNSILALAWTKQGCVCWWENVVCAGQSRFVRVSSSWPPIFHSIRQHKKKASANLVMKDKSNKNHALASMRKFILSLIFCTAVGSDKQDWR